MKEAAPLLEEGITAMERKDRMLKKLIEEIRDVLEKVENEEKQEMTDQQDEWIGAEIGRDGLSSTQRQETTPSANPDVQHEAAKIITEPLEAEMYALMTTMKTSHRPLREISCMSGVGWCAGK